MISPIRENADAARRNSVRVLGNPDGRVLVHLAGPSGPGEVVRYIEVYEQ